MPAYDASSFHPPAPMAKVTLRNQDNGMAASDVPMLLDTGADVTLIPQSFMGELGLTTDPKEGFELMAFDGRLSVALAVQLDLILLRRVFRGRYLIINQEYGVIGRNIINQVSLLFDGPRLNWNEEKPTG